jgi:hypothetical protein
MQLRASGSVLQLRSPVADIGIAANADAQMRMTMTVGETGGAHELARWRLADAPGAFTAFDAYAGIRYMYVGVDANLDAIGVVNSAALGLNEVGANGSTRQSEFASGTTLRRDRSSSFEATSAASARAANSAGKPSAATVTISSSRGGRSRGCSAIAL